MDQRDGFNSRLIHQKRLFNWKTESQKIEKTGTKREGGKWKKHYK